MNLSHATLQPYNGFNSQCRKHEKGDNFKANHSYKYVMYIREYL